MYKYKIFEFWNPDGANAWLEENFGRMEVVNMTECISSGGARSVCILVRWKE